MSAFVASITLIIAKYLYVCMYVEDIDVFVAMKLF